MKRLLVICSAIVLTTFVIAGGLFVGHASPGGASTGAVATWREDSIPPGVSVKVVGTNEVFVRRTGDDVQVFELDVHHLAGEHELWWCPKEQVFAAPTHGEMFAPDGDVLSGPAQRGLDRLDVLGVGSNVRVFDRVIPGRPPGDLQRPPKAGSGPPWDSGPGSFCAGALRS